MNTLPRHLLASVAYRLDKALAGSDASFTGYSPGKEVRTPLELINHLVNLLSLMEAELMETERIHWQTCSLKEGQEQFHFVAEEIEHFLEFNEVDEELLKLLLQGPLSDMLTHIGQLAMMRRLSGKPVQKENFMKARIDLQRKRRMQAQHVSGS